MLIKVVPYFFVGDPLNNPWGDIERTINKRSQQDTFDNTQVDLTMNPIAATLRTQLIRETVIATHVVPLSTAPCSVGSLVVTTGVYAA